MVGVFTAFIVALAAAIGATMVVGWWRKTSKPVYVDSTQELPPGVSPDDVGWCAVSQRPVAQLVPWHLSGREASGIDEPDV